MAPRNTNDQLFGQSQTDDSNFIKGVVGALIAFAFIGIVVPNISLPEMEREEKAKLPPQLARVLLEKEEIKQPEPKPEPPSEPEPEPEEQPEPEVVEPTPEPEIEPEPEPVTQVTKAREKANVSGVLQFKDTLADMREAISTEAVASKDITRGQAEAERTERSLITSGAEADSGGINTSELSIDTGGVALSGRETTQVESELGGADATAAASAAQNKHEAGQRSDEEIRSVMSQHASALDRYYRRALRANPALQGKVVLKLVINPDGSLASVSIVSSDLNDAELKSKVLARVKLISFEARNNVRVTTRNYTFSFMPQL